MRAFAAAFAGIASAPVAAIRAAAARATIALANLDMGHLFWFAPCYRTIPNSMGFPTIDATHIVCRVIAVSASAAINPIGGERTADDESDGTRRPAGGGRRLPGGGIGDNASRTT